MNNQVKSESSLDYSDLVNELRSGEDGLEYAAADAIELLQRELKCANELWEQQKELALEYLADIELDKENKRIAELEEFQAASTRIMMAQYDRLAEIEAALKPFAEVAERYAYRMPDISDEDVIVFELKYFNAAKTALENGDGII